MPCPAKCGELGAQRIWVEAAIAPGNLFIVDVLVVDSVIAERAEQTPTDAVKEVSVVDQVVITELQDVGLVRAVRRCRQSQQELGPEVL